MDAGSLDAGALIDAAIEHAAAGYDASQYPRTTCCSKKRKFYCPECFSLLGKDKIEGSDKTEGSDNPNPSATLPFDVDVILHDDKDVATGVHIKVLAQSQTNIIDFDGKGKDPEIPDYDPAITYILFPSDTSVPLSSLPPPAKLVVLDCKWSKTISSQHPSLRDLPKVHLSNPPAVSRYWRWHGKGEGMVCTLEAVYCAALECASVKQTPISNLQALFHLFGIQREAMSASIQSDRAEGVKQHYRRKVEPEGMPWEANYKAAMVKERKQEGGERQKQQKEDSKREKKRAKAAAAVAADSKAASLTI